MDEMIERVAKALADHRGVPIDERRSDAIAAIEAMREPTDEMKRSGGEYIFADDFNTDSLAGSVWEGMIDAALGKVDA